jgi:hypothetical protein
MPRRAIFAPTRNAAFLPPAHEPSALARSDFRENFHLVQGLSISLSSS